MRKIAVIGTGYVGLVSGAGLSDFGNEVVCADINEKKIELLNQGEIPIFEPGLKELVDRNITAGRLSFTRDIDRVIKDSEVIFLAVWTPMSENGEADLSAVKEVSKTIGKNLNGYKIICTKSTVPVGTGAMIREIIENHQDDHVEFDVVSNPEFLREGAAVRDFLWPDRVVIGTESQKSMNIMREIYRPLFINETPMILTDIPTAETIKYASNAFLAVKISYINEIANLCDELGADVHIVAKAMGLDGRISPKFLHPGPGYGGSCFPKDTHALLHMGESAGIDLNVVNAAVKTNINQRQRVIQKITQLFDEKPKGKTVAILGLTFKPDTDDVRESPAIEIIQWLLKKGVSVQAYDPQGIDNMKEKFPEVSYMKSTEDAVRGADLVVVLTDWHEFRAMDIGRVSQLVNQKILLDTRNILNPVDLKRYNFRFDNVGRPNVK